MFKPVTAAILLLAFVAQTFASPFIMLDYAVNTESYAKNCVNKARPKMHCNGKCQMMKKIHEQEKKDQQNSENKADAKAQVLSSRSSFCSVKIFSKIIKKEYPQENINCTIDRALSFFHPPQV